MSSKKGNIQSQDIKFMKLALSIARQNDGLTGQNPSVGCVITNDNKIISIGSTSVKGRPHAEFNALNGLKQNLNNSTLYVTMEPCDHFGKTPPCTNLIIKKKIKRVVYAVEDVDKRTSFKAYSKLKLKRIKVKRYVCKKEAQKFYKKYFFYKKQKKPYVIGKIACSKDKFIKSKNRKYITNDYSLNVTHLLRYRNEGILVSYKTVNNDNPILNCRISGLEKFSPKRFVLDKDLKSKKNSIIFNQLHKKKTFILHNSTDYKKIKYFKSQKIKLIRTKMSKNKTLDLKNVLSQIFKQKVNSLLVEGGEKLTNNFINLKLFNEFFLFESSVNLKKTGQINIKNTIRQIQSNFKNSKIIDTFTDNDKITHFY